MIARNARNDPNWTCPLVGDLKGATGVRHPSKAASREEDAADGEARGIQNNTADRNSAIPQPVLMREDTIELPILNRAGAAHHSQEVKSCDEVWARHQTPACAPNEWRISCEGARGSRRATS